MLKEDGKMIIGVLSIQGGVIEHLTKISELGYNGIEVKSLIDLDKIDKLIIPGGESTTICKILNEEKLIEPLREKIKLGMKVWGTCAGLIMLAKIVENNNLNNIGLMNIEARRNAFGRQLGSFNSIETISELGIDNFECVFIRAPIITNIGENVRVIHTISKNIVAACEKNIFVTSFHPELTNDNRFHKYFIERF